MTPHPRPDPDPLDDLLAEHFEATLGPQLDRPIPGGERPEPFGLRRFAAALAVAASVALVGYVVVPAAGPAAAPAAAGPVLVGTSAAWGESDPADSPLVMVAGTPVRVVARAGVRTATFHDPRTGYDIELTWPASDLTLVEADVTY